VFRQNAPARRPLLEVTEKNLPDEQQNSRKCDFKPHNSKKCRSEKAENRKSRLSEDSAIPLRAFTFYFPLFAK